MIGRWRHELVLLTMVVTMVALLSFVASARAAGPRNTTPPDVSGVAQQGATLTEVNGAWNSPPTALAYQWELCTTTCAPIARATSQAYVVQAGDVGHSLEVRERATDAGGSTWATSSPTAIVTGNTGPPGVAGVAQQGQTLTLIPGQWNETPAPTLTEQWAQCDTDGANCVAINGATASSYVPVASDVGHTLSVLETATNAISTATASSPPTAVILPPAPSPTSAPSITGVLAQGNVLTGEHGGWTNSPSSLIDAWFRCDAAGANCGPISGAVSQTYTLTAADVGATLVALETATNSGGSGSAFSAATGVITAAAPVIPVPINGSPPTIAGSTLQGEILSETHGIWSDAPTSYGYQWERCRSDGCVPLLGATGQTYVTTAADVGAKIVVLETAQNAGGSSAPSASAPSPVVTASSSLAVVVSVQAPRTNQSVALVATIGSSSANAAPDGVITFYAGSNAINGCSQEAVNPSGPIATVICQSTFAAGPQVVSAGYTPGANTAVKASSSTPETLDVGRDVTSTSLAVTRKVRMSQRASYNATLVLPAGNSGPLAPTGSLAFYDAGRAITRCRKRPLLRLSATCVVRYKVLGRHRISVRYSGDPNFAPSTSPTRLVHVVKGFSGPRVLGFINATLQWEFAYHPRYTHVSMLKAFGLSQSTAVWLTCAGPGCPFSRRHELVGRRTSLDLRPTFQDRRLGSGAQIVVRITRPQWIGKFYAFTIRAGHSPLVALSCLGVGATLPGAGC